ncbi:MAG: ceramidase domain-containing protein [Bosea sp. (in: a-proteobacteria)]
MDLHQHIDLYCERTSSAFWAEPINAISNSGFILAALLGLWRWRQAGGRDWPALAMIVLVAMIGIGSFLFHTFANRWSLMADVIPIQLFMLGMFGLMLVRLVGWPVWTALLGALVFLGTGLLAPRAAALLGLGDSAGAAFGYGTGLVAMLLLGGWAVLMGSQPRADVGRWVLGAALVFGGSLTARQLDVPLCDLLPMGTHFLWHALNAVTLGLLLVSAIELRRLKAIGAIRSAGARSARSPTR